jgi:auxin-responsive protein IAA
MFIESCKRLRIMKRSEAKGFGLQPRGALIQQGNISKDDRD